jgi:hypothetical protein
MIDNIIGLITLPVSVVLFLNIFGITQLNDIFGISILLIAAIAHVANQIANVIAAHISDNWVILSYVIHGVMLFPSIIYFISLVAKLPANITAPLPVIFASFIFIEGIYSFFIGD